MSEVTLSLHDAAALCVGRLILAWGELDFRIEALMVDLWSTSFQREVLAGIATEERPPAEGRSSQRLKLLRRYFSKVAEDDAAAMAEFDRLVGRLNKVEKIRSSAAHGLAMFGHDEGEPHITTWSFTDAEKGGHWDRKDHLQKFTLTAISEAATEAVRLEKEFRDLAQIYKKAFILRAFANHAANSRTPTTSLNPGSGSGSSRSQAVRYRSSTSASALSLGFKPPKP